MKRNEKLAAIGVLVAAGIAKLIHRAAYKNGTRDAWYQAQGLMMKGILESQIKDQKKREGNENE